MMTAAGMRAAVLLFVGALATPGAIVHAEPYRCNVNGKAVYQEAPCNAAAPKGNTAADLQAEFEREQAAKRQASAPRASQPPPAGQAAASVALGQHLVQGKKICVASWMLALKDPDSARLENYEGAMVADAEYFAQIHGRAKNSFGGYVRSTWNCRALLDGGQLKVVSLEEVRS
jgi:hypothetical protein